ncbi:MAG: hypothetical protein SangKO_009480 [Sandaracinaceae bacterium]
MNPDQRGVHHPAMRLLLKPPSGRDEVDSAAIALGWSLANVFPQREGRPRQVIYATAEGLITLVEDHRIDARYLVFSGHDPEGLAAQAREVVETLDEDAVLEILAREPARGLCWLGIVGASREASEKALRDALGGEAPELRAAARFAAEALGWEVEA